MEENSVLTFLSSMGKVILATAGLGLILISSADKVIMPAIRLVKKIKKECLKK